MGCLGLSLLIVGCLGLSLLIVGCLTEIEPAHCGMSDWD